MALFKLATPCSTWRIWLFIAAGTALIATIYFEAIYASNDMAGTDFFKFHLSARYLQQDKSIYWLPPDHLSADSPCYQDSTGQHPNQKNTGGQPAEVALCLHPNLNPPIFAALAAPLTWVNYTVSWWIWSLASIGCGIGSLMLIFRSSVLPALSPSAASLIGVIFFAYYPTFANVSYGQVSLFLLLLLTLGWLAWRNGKLRTAGCWFGIAASLKPFIGLFLIVFLLNRNWRALVAFISVGILAFLLGGMAAGFHSYLEYATILKQITWQAANWNASFTGFFYRIFGGSESTPWINAPTVARGLTTLSNLTILAVLARIAFKPVSFDHATNADILVALTIPAMLLLSPLGWMYYFPMLFICFIVIWNLTKNLSNRRIYRLLLALGTVPTIIPNPLVPSAEVTPKAWLWDEGRYFYMLLLIFIMIAVIATYQNSMRARE
jgi:alpha-1,2-mannosyltransferase